MIKNISTPIDFVGLSFVELCEFYESANIGSTKKSTLNGIGIIHQNLKNI